MSEIRVDTITEKTSGAGTTVSNLKNPNEPFRNLIINGDFRVFQRASGSTAVGNGTYSTADRFKTHFSNDGAATTQQHTLSDADRATTGHSFAWQWDVGTADTSLAAGQLAYFRQFIEAQNCSGLAYGSSAAKTAYLSFWVKSSKTGTYCCTIHKHDSTTYNLPIEYTISSADTWEHKTLTISPTAGSTSLITGSGGDIAQDNGKGIIIDWWLASGSDYTGGTNNTWSSNTNHLATTNQVNWLDSTSNDFYITGIQFETDAPTDFEHLPYDVQLQRCSRYFQTLHLSSNGIMTAQATATTNTHLGFQHPNGEMRTSPTVTLPTAGNSSNTTAFLTAPGAYPSTIGSHAASVVSQHLVRIDGTSYSANFVAGNTSLFYSNGTNTFKMDAEL